MSRRKRNKLLCVDDKSHYGGTLLGIEVGKTYTEDGHQVSAEGKDQVTLIETNLKFSGGPHWGSILADSSTRGSEQDLLERLS